MTKSISLSTTPPSVNAMYRGRRYLTKEGKAAKEAIQWELKHLYKGKLREGNVCLNIVFYMKNKRIDIDNQLKGLLDCMTGVIYKDDRQIVELHVFKEVNKKNPRTEIQVL